jgi:lysyl-tRNA synthetase class II
MSSAEDIRCHSAAKVSELRAAGQEPYGYRFDRTHTAAELQATHAALEARTGGGGRGRGCGWGASWRLVMGSSLSCRCKTKAAASSYTAKSCA